MAVSFNFSYSCIHYCSADVSLKKLFEILGNFAYLLPCCKLDEEIDPILEVVWDIYIYIYICYSYWPVSLA